MLLAARAHLSQDAIVNVVSAPERLPSVDDLWRLWCDRVARPHELIFHAGVEEAPLRALDPRQRAFLNFTAVNAEISSRDWRFATGNRDALIAQGARFPHVSVDTIARCQSRFVTSSEIVRSYYENYSAQFPGAAADAPLVEAALAD